MSGNGWICPHDVPIAYIHATVRDGGLGIPSLRWLGPRLRLSRLETFSSIYSRREPAGGNLADFISLQISRTRSQAMRHDGTMITSKAREQRMWASCLYEAVDGKALTRSANVSPQSLWLSDGTTIFTGRNFIQCVKTRINALTARSRITHARQNHNRSCLAGCFAVETPMCQIVGKRNGKRKR